LKFACKSIPWYLHEVDKLTSKKYAKTINLLCKDNKVFVKYQAQGVDGANQKKKLEKIFFQRNETGFFNEMKRMTDLILLLVRLVFRRYE